MEQLEPMSPRPMEILLNVGFVVLVAFAVFAVVKVIRREWPVGYALTLVVLTAFIPFSGPVLALARAAWLRRSGRPGQLAGANQG